MLSYRKCISLCILLSTCLNNTYSTESLWTGLFGKTPNKVEVKLYDKLSRAGHPTIITEEFDQEISTIDLASKLLQSVPDLGQLQGRKQALLLFKPQDGTQITDSKIKKAPPTPARHRSSGGQKSDPSGPELGVICSLIKIQVFQELLDAISSIQPDVKTKSDTQPLISKIQTAAQALQGALGTESDRPTLDRLPCQINMHRQNSEPSVLKITVRGSTEGKLTGVEFSWSFNQQQVTYNSIINQLSININALDNPTVIRVSEDSKQKLIDAVSSLVTALSILYEPDIPPTPSK